MTLLARPQIVYFSLPVRGHVAPAAAVVRELALQHASVLAFSGEATAPLLSGAGAAVWPYPPELEAALRAPSDNFLEVAAVLAELTERVMLPFALERLRSVQPDVVVSDSMAPWGRLAAERLGLPTITLTSSFVVHAGLGGSLRPALDVARRARLAAGALGRIRAVRRRLLDAERVDIGGPLQLLSNRGEVTIVFTSRQLQPAASRLGPGVEFVGAPLAEPGAAADAAAWAHERPGDPLMAELDRLADRELIYVALGTLYNDRPAFLRACAEGLSGPGRAVLLALGSAVDPGALGRLPEGVIGRSWVPQRAILQRAAAFVSHGGMNSVNEALWEGVPLVLFPQAADQPVVASRIQHLGAGEVLRGKEPGAEQIALRTASVLAGPAARRATELGQTLRSGGGAVRAAELILRRCGAWPAELAIGGPRST
jgi:MGT family glycosyltransferase